MARLSWRPIQGRVRASAESTVIRLRFGGPRAWTIRGDPAKSWESKAMRPLTSGGNRPQLPELSTPGRGRRKACHSWDAACSTAARASWKRPSRPKPNPQFFACVLRAAAGQIGLFVTESPKLRKYGRSAPENQQLRESGPTPVHFGQSRCNATGVWIDSLHGVQAYVFRL